MPLYIIHALKELPLIKKKMEKNRELLQQHSSGISTVLPEFKDKDKQTKYVNSLLQSNIDLARRYLKLKNCLAYTNAVSKITIDGLTYSVVELITIRKEMGNEVDRTYSSLNDRQGHALLGRYGSGAAKDGPTLVCYYDAQRKSADEKKWYDFWTKIDAELEIFNARTFLLDPETGKPIDSGDPEAAVD